MVGIEGGASSKKHDIRLDDVVIGCPVGRTRGVLSYEFGKAMQGKDFEITEDLNSSSTVLLTTLNQLDTLHEGKGNRIVDIVRMMISRNLRMREKYNYSRAKKNRWYESNYVHVDSNLGCDTIYDHDISPMI